MQKISATFMDIMDEVRFRLLIFGYDDEQVMNMTMREMYQKYISQDYEQRQYSDSTCLYNVTDGWVDD